MKNRNKIEQTNKHLTSKGLKKNNLGKEKEKKIRSVLIKMKVKDVESWPMYRADTVRSTVFRLQPQLGIKFSTRKVDDILIVTRIA
jgi:hypothetical protein